MEVEISTDGVSTHCSHPERGENAVYAMASIVQALDSLHRRMSDERPSHESGAVAVTAISSESPSDTAIPDGCTIHVDRRMTLGESADHALAELRALPEVQAGGAEVRVIHYDEPSWRGLAYPTDKVFPAWETPTESPAVSAALATARRVLGREPRLHRSAVSSSGCVTAGIFGIPTVGFGPADEVHAHTVDDQIPLAQLQPAMAFFAMFPELYVRG
jgi:putative selenium metabolism hydrolase